METLPYDIEVFYDNDTTTIYGVTVTPKDGYAFNSEFVTEMFEHFAKSQGDAKVIGFSIRPAKEDVMEDKMTVAEFINSVDAEGGLKGGFDSGYSPADLDPNDNMEFYMLVESAYEAYQGFHDAEDNYYTFVETAEY